MSAVRSASIDTREAVDSGTETEVGAVLFTVEEIGGAPTTLLAIREALPGRVVPFAVRVDRDEAASRVFAVMAPVAMDETTSDLGEFQMTVGRDMSMDVSLEVSELSRHHCTIRGILRGGVPTSIMVRDEGSLNGTAAFGVQLAPRQSVEVPISALSANDDTFVVTLCPQRPTRLVLTLLYPPSAPAANEAAAGRNQTQGNKRGKRVQLRQAAIGHAIGRSVKQTSDRSPAVLVEPVQVSPEPVASSPSPLPSIVVITVGMRLSPRQLAGLRLLGITVNPPTFEEYRRAKYLVVSPPLSRSIKLMVALCYVDEALSCAWLERSLALGHMEVPRESDHFREVVTRRSVEGLYAFRVSHVLTIPAARRQSLLRGHTMRIHPACAPQEPPLNDLASVIEAAGGLISPDEATATVVILPEEGLATGVVTRYIRTVEQKRRNAPTLFVTPEAIFGAVLRQQPLTASTVEVQRGTSRSRAKRRRDEATVIVVD